MADAFRWRFRACVTLCAFAATLVLPFSASHAWLNDDTACEPAVSAAPLQVSAASTPAPVRHCPYCHWQRVVGGAAVASIHADLPWLDVVEPNDLAPVVPIESRSIQHGPSRAPPSLRFA